MVPKNSSSQPSKSVADDPQLSKAMFVSARLAKGMAHPLRIEIVVELNKRAMSPSQFLRECCDESLTLGRVAHHFRALKKQGFIEEVYEKSGGHRRGATEHFYRAVQRSAFDGSTFTNLPRSIRGEVTGATLSTYFDRVAQAMKAGTMDTREDRHVTWTAQTLDQQGWEDMVKAVDELFNLAVEIQVESGLRLAKSGEQPIPATTGLFFFESPPTPSEPHDPDSGR